MMPPQDIVGVTTAVVATVILALRIFTRLRIRRQSFDSSDYLYGAACTFMWVFVAFCIAFYHDFITAATSKPYDQAAEDLMKRSHVYQYVASTGRGLGLCFIKISILLFHLRLSRARWVRWAVTIISVLVVLYIVLNIIFEGLGFAVSLAEVITTAVIPEGIFWYTMNIITDLCCLVIPAAIVLPLELRTGKKLSVIALFGICSIPNAAGIWSFVFFMRQIPILADAAINATPQEYFRLRDEGLKLNLVLTLIECNGGIICAGIPTIWIFFTHFLPSMVQYYLHPSRYLASPTGATTSTTGVDRCKCRSRRTSTRPHSLSLDEMPPAMRWDSDEPRTALHQAHASESGTAILRVSPTITEEDDDNDSLSSTERDTAGTKGADGDEAVGSPKEVKGVSSCGLTSRSSEATASAPIRERGFPTGRRRESPRCR
ncbi:hypothetical protein PG996_004137 [Apiospora saccharicola]|uniref:Rhodopsin domain-containing protein n=1 Tax=Apiospora saccharicola TaxID=335842 RepID=A0ABR1W3F8_9PEZI